MASLHGYLHSGSSARGPSQRTARTLSPARLRPGSNQVLQRPSATFTGAPFATPSTQPGSIAISSTPLPSALGKLLDPAQINADDIGLLTDEDAIGDLDFVSIMSNRKLNYTQCHSMCETAETTPGMVLTDVFRGLREQNVKVVRAINLLIGAGRHQKAVAADLTSRIGDLTAATNTLITTTRSIKSELSITDTNIRAVRNHMLLVQDQIKHLLETTGRGANVSGDRSRSPLRSYNMYGRVYGIETEKGQLARVDPMNALSVSALANDGRATTPTSIRPGECDQEPAEEGHHVPEYMRRIAEQEALKPHADSGLLKAALSNNTLRFVRTPSASGKVSAAQGEHAASHGHGQVRVPASLKKVGAEDQAPDTPAQSEGPHTSFAAQSGIAEDRERPESQRVSAIERNLRRVMDHLGLKWED